MNSRINSRARFRPAPRGGAAALAVAVAALAASTLGGCSSSDSTTTNRLDEFLGKWAINDPSVFTVNCPGTMPASFQIWSELTMEEGTVTDLVETSGLCHIRYNVSKDNATIAAIANPDPFTAVAPTCRVDLSDATGVLLVDVSPTSWTFNLNKPVKGQAPGAQLLGAAGIQLVTVDANNNEVPSDVPCTYDVRANLSKLSRD